MNIILFDGECNLCNHSVRFIIKHDPKGLFHFASLQSATGQHLTEKRQQPDSDLSSVIYIEDGKYYTRSTAILQILKKIGGVWKLMYIFIIIPPFIRNFIYKLISNTRYRIFGKTTSCKTLSGNFRDRFLD